jgi:hypothetical protein
VAGIGDEVRAHFLHPPHRRQVVKGQQQDIGRRIARARHRDDEGFEPAFRDGFGEFHTLWLPALAGKLDCVNQCRNTNRDQSELALSQSGCEPRRLRIESQHAPAAAERDYRVRKAGDHRLKNWIAVNLGRQIGRCGRLFLCEIHRYESRQ